MRVGRNDTCPCGSGKKFKNCCEGKGKRGMSGGLMALVAAMAAIALVGLASLVMTSRETNKPAAASSVPSPRANAPQPGPAPAGKVWSTEHGHWHDAAPNAGARPGAVPAATTALPTTPQPQPPGPAPAGKVWSAEHGHWHDAPR